uniref:Uncharacterized protein n=1 Tax=Populus alba TaxID=43335 RepID=A0A4U5QNM3_POPAL|nr:hypothetical protein D5086_0000078420 [Populus alba]
MGATGRQFGAQARSLPTRIAQLPLMRLCVHGTTIPVREPRPRGKVETPKRDRARTAGRKRISKGQATHHWGTRRISKGQATSHAAATTSKVPCPQPQSQAGVDKGTVFGRLGPQPPPQISPPTVQGHPQDNNIQEASEDTTRPEVSLENSTGWVTVVSHKSSKQHKGKVVAGFEPMLANNSPAPPSLHACTCAVHNSSQTDPLVATSCVGKVQGFSTTPTALLVVHSCDGEAHNSSPTRTNIVATTAGDTVMVSNPVNVPSLDVADQCGVRTCHQKQRDRSGRVSSSLHSHDNTQLEHQGTQ